MILSLSHNFLFIHVYKVAGMSIEGALDGADIRETVAGLSPEAQTERLKAQGVDPAVLAMGRHVTAHDMRQALDPALYDRLFKFAFVRNPWDLQLSLYHFNLKHPEFQPPESTRNYSSFERFVLDTPAQGHPLGQQRKFLVDGNGNEIVDFVGRFETLEKDFAAVCARIGMDVPPLERRNTTDHDPWQRCYTLEMFEHVRVQQNLDIKAFGYSPDPAAYGLE